MNDRTDPPTTAEAWLDVVAYHRDRAIQEKGLAECSKTVAGRAAHLLLSERHIHLMASAEDVVQMTDPELPQSSARHVTERPIPDSSNDQS